MTESNDWQTPRGTATPGAVDASKTSTPGSEVSAVDADEINAGGPELGGGPITAGTTEGYPLGATSAMTRDADEETAATATEPTDRKEFRGFETGAAERTGGAGGD